MAVAVREVLRWRQSGNNEVDIFGGPVAPLPSSLSALRDSVIRGEADACQAQSTSEARLRRAATVIQSAARRWLCHLRYQRHLTLLRRDLDALKLRREAVAAITVQRLVRGLLHRVHYRIQRQRQEEIRQEEMAKANAKGGAAKGKKGPPPPPPALIDIPRGRGGVDMIRTLSSSHTAAAMLRNVAFVTAMRAFFSAKWDEAVIQFEVQLKVPPLNDPIVTRMIFVSKKRSGLLGEGAVQGSNAAGGAKKKK